MKTKHSSRGCTTCREYARHESARRPIGNWVARLGTVHLCASHSVMRMACGRVRAPGMIWTITPRLATCRVCRLSRARGVARGGA